MDIKEYIASGIVELYSMNALTPEEKKEFERNVLLYPEVAAELKNVQEALEDYSISHSLNPRPQLRGKIIQEIFSGEKNDKKKIRSIASSNYSLTYKYLIAASLAALIVSTFASWFFYSRWNDAEDRYTVLLNEKNQLAQNYNVVKSTYDESMTELLVMRDVNTSVIVLNPKDTTKHFQARVYWNKLTQHSFIDVLSLPAPADGKQFQLWALVNGKPVDAGVFTAADTGVQRVKDVINAQVWAVTLEPKGGSAVPTLEQLYLISKSS